MQEMYELKKLKHIGFHDLRHSYASLLVASKVPMKNIEEWLGHSNFNTTADVYSHLDYTSKYECAGVISKALTPEFKEETENINDEIEELEKMLAEKRKRLKEQEEEM